MYCHSGAGHPVCDAYETWVRILPDTGKQNWLKLVSVGEAGIRDGHQIRSYPNKLGCLARGPHKQLDEGTYLLSLNTEPFLTILLNQQMHRA